MDEKPHSVQDFSAVLKHDYKPTTYERILEWYRYSEEESDIIKIRNAIETLDL